jgi:hypothetical protein
MDSSIKALDVSQDRYFADLHPPGSRYEIIGRRIGDIGYAGSTFATAIPLMEGGSL